MPVAIHYDVDGVGKVEHRLLAMAARAVEPRPLLEAFSVELERMMQDRFDAQGPGWAPLSPVTIARKGSSTIGRETDAMMESLTSENAEGATREIFGDELVFGTHLTTEDGFPYPKAFHDGTRTGQPARPLFDLSVTDLRPFTKAVHAWLMGAERAEFGVGDFALGLTSPFGV